MISNSLFDDLVGSKARSKKSSMKSSRASKNKDKHDDIMKDLSLELDNNTVKTKKSKRSSSKNTKKTKSQKKKVDKVDPELLSNTTIQQSIYLEKEKVEDMSDEIEEQEDEFQYYGNEELFQKEEKGEDQITRKVNKNADTKNYWHNIEDATK